MSTSRPRARIAEALKRRALPKARLVYDALASHPNGATLDQVCEALYGRHYTTREQSHARETLIALIGRDLANYANTLYTITTH